MYRALAIALNTRGIKARSAAHLLRFALLTQFRAGTLHFTRLRPGAGHPADSFADLTHFKLKGLTNLPHHPPPPGVWC